MEEPRHPIDSVEKQSAKTAEMLRSMLEQANKALESHRLKIGDIETELSRRVKQIAEELARDRTADETEAAVSTVRREELNLSQKALREAETEIAALRGQLTAVTSDRQAEIAARDEQLQQLLEDRDRLSQERTSLSEELGQVLTDQLISAEEVVILAEQLESQQEDLNRTSQERDQLADQLLKLREEHDELCLDRSGLAEALNQLRTDRDQLAEEHNRLADELEQLLADAEESDGLHDQLTGELEELGKQQEAIQGERDQLAEDLERLLEDAKQNELQREQLTGELEQLQGQHSQLVGEQEQLVEEFHQFRTQHEQLTGQRDLLEGELQAAREALDEVREEKAGESTRLNEELTAVRESHSLAQETTQSLEAQLQTLRQEHEQTCQALEAARAASDELTKNEQLVVELNETLDQQKTEHARQVDQQKEHLEESDRKCELALADVHKLKRANAELHEELVSRPETDDQDSPELVSLRAERDALAGRVEELENAPLPELDDDSQQEFSDMQRRFEMAVEDVRSLKQENASLREQLEASPKAPAVASDSGDMGWQAQRARLLASLDAEDEGQVTPQRLEERTTIEGTLSITDRVVSEKDIEIAALKAQLQKSLSESKSGAETEIEIAAVREEAQRAAHEELFSNDEIIQNERKRLELLQHEWKDKLRTAELEISVQRATLARERSKLEEKLAFLESQTAELEKNDGKPKHRWLSALGLNDEDDG